MKCLNRYIIIQLVKLSQFKEELFINVLKMFT